jgi:hypothetical protein
MLPNIFTDMTIRMTMSKFNLNDTFMFHIPAVELPPVVMAFVFHNDQCIMTFAVVRPAGNNGTFSVMFRAPNIDKNWVSVYIAGVKVTAVRQHYLQEINYYMSYGNEEELAQDLKASGYTAEAFPELEKFLK